MALAISFAVAANAQAPAILPLSLDVEPQHTESIYAPVEIVGQEQGTNQGGVNVDLSASYLTDYVWRGIDRSESGGTEDSPNLQIEGTMKWDLGKWPHPFIGVFTNIYDSDPTSRFQEIRPYFGLEWTARPINLAVGHNNYIFPDRDENNTAEIFASLELDDSYFFRSDQPIFKPYIVAAYDYDNYQGMYFEVGISHDFQIEDTPLTLTPRAAVAYVSDNTIFRTGGLPPDDNGFEPGTSGPDSGWQHYEFGLEATYEMNQLLNMPLRYGKLDLKAYINYTDGLQNDLRATTGWWGGVGVAFSY